MLTVSKLIGRSAGLAASLRRRAAVLELDWDTRQKSRFDGTDSLGRSLGVFLPRGQVVRGGDVLVGEDGSLIAVVAKPQPVLVVHAHGPSAALALARAAYHLGNRHIALEVQADRLQLEPDHVLAEMLARMGLHVEEALAAFEPEGGAYQAAGSAHGHDHGRAHGHDHADDHGHGHAQEPADADDHDRAHTHHPGCGHDHGHGAVNDHEASTFLQLARLASPSLPVGGFSYSEGLEAAVEAGHIRNEAQARDWLLDQLQLSLVRGDLAVVALATAAWKADDATAVADLNAWVATTRETREQRLQSEQMGRSLGLWLRHRTGNDGPALDALEALLPAPTWPIAFALAAAQGDASPPAALLAFAAGWAENMVQAAMRAVPLGQIAAQRILDALAAEMPSACDAAMAVDRASLQSFAPMLAILSSQHEAQYSRLFRS